MPEAGGVVIGGLVGAPREQSSLKLMSPRGRIWLPVNAITLPMPWEVASQLPDSGRAAVLPWV